jgi:hypothetical protein
MVNKALRENSRNTKETKESAGDRGRNRARSSPYERSMAFHTRTNWHSLPKDTIDSGERWSIIWDTKRRAESEGRNTAVEKFEAAALDRAKHLLRMGFVVYEIRTPQGAVLLEEAGIRERVGLRPDEARAAERRADDLTSTPPAPAGE